MRILYTNFHSGSGVGGHTVYVASLARAFAARHEVTVAAPRGSGLYRRAMQIPGVNVEAQIYPNRPFQLWPAIRKLRALIAEQSIQVVHVNGSSDHRAAILASVAMGAARPRIVFTKHNDLPISWLGASVRARVGTHHVIGVCNSVTDALKNSPYRRCPVTAIANGVDTRYYAPMDLSAALAWRRQHLGVGEHEAKIVLGSHAGTDNYKGWMDLVQAVAQLPSADRNRVHIALAGAYPQAWQQAQVAQVGMTGQVTFVGPLDDVRLFIAAIDAGFVLSYRVETISFACREMMAMGKPVIVSAHASLPDNITCGQDGWVVAERDVAALRTLVAGIVAQPARLALMGSAARAKSVREFGLERFVARTEQVYRSVLGCAPAMARTPA